MKDITMKRKKFRSRSLKEKDAASDLNESAGGDYFCDYSPRYQEKYSIYDKAKAHAKQQRKNVEKK